MAILRNREVIYLGPADAGSTSRTVRVQQKDGSVEICRLNELRFTEDEKKELVKSEENQVAGYNSISDKELKELRASIDPKQADKLAEKQRKDMESDSNVSR